ncbi:MAG: hypothetical protein K2F77_02705, partial [Muribaculaceae bacterium]|nr:hypothetical protein [Muribaculaceae bacterium]
MNLLSITATAAVMSLTSPDGSHRIDIRHDADTASRVSYDVMFRGNPVVVDGTMGLDLDNRSWEMALALGKRQLPQPDRWMCGMVLDSLKYQTYDATRHQLYDERT